MAKTVDANGVKLSPEIIKVMLTDLDVRPSKVACCHWQRAVWENTNFVSQIVAGSQESSPDPIVGVIKNLYEVE